jgi:hypothetical protein
VRVEVGGKRQYLFDSRAVTISGRNQLSPYLQHPLIPLEKRGVTRDVSKGDEGMLEIRR